MDPDASGIRSSAATSSSRATRASPISRSTPAPSQGCARCGARPGGGALLATSPRRARRAGIERGLRDVDGAVPIPLGLDDGPELGSFRRTQERRGVPANRPEVEGEARPLHVVDSRKSEIPEWGSRSRADPEGGRVRGRGRGERPATGSASRSWSGTCRSPHRRCRRPCRCRLGASLSRPAKDAVVATLAPIVSTAALPRTRFEDPESLNAPEPVVTPASVSAAGSPGADGGLGAFSRDRCGWCSLQRRQSFPTSALRRLGVDDHRLRVDHDAVVALRRARRS